MQLGLNCDKHDPKFILLGKVFKFIGNEKIKGIYGPYDVKKGINFVIHIKILFMWVFFNYNISEVINELN